MNAFLASLAVSVVAVGLAIPVLRRWEVLDTPNQRSSHSIVVPRGGGLGVLAGVAVGTVAGRAGSDKSYLVLLIAVLLGIVGLVDDIRGVSAVRRLAVQLVVCFFASVVLFGSDQRASGTVVVAMAALWLVGFTNAFNFMDGINGISGLTAAVAGAWFAMLGERLDDPTVLVLGLAVAGASAGFLPWNAHKARVFLGDVGSYGLGVLIAVLALLSRQAGAGILESFAPLLVYAADTSWALAKRLLRGAVWREAHREHVYQRLVDGGWTHGTAAAMVAGSAALLGLLAVALPAPLAWTACAAVLVCYLALPRLTSRAHETTTRSPG